MACWAACLDGLILAGFGCRDDRIEAIVEGFVRHVLAARQAVMVSGNKQ